MRVVAFIAEYLALVVNPNLVQLDALLGGWTYIYLYIHRIAGPASALPAMAQLNRAPNACKFPSSSQIRTITSGGRRDAKLPVETEDISNKAVQNVKNNQKARIRRVGSSFEQKFV